MLALLPMLIACSTPDTPTVEPAAYPAPTVVPAAPAPSQPEAEDDAAGQTLQLAFGEQCAEPAAGEPTRVEDVRAAMKAAGHEPTKVELLPTCQACGSCPRVAFAITSMVDLEELQKIFPKAKL